MQHQTGSPGGADVEVILAGCNHPGLENEIAAPERGSSGDSGADFGSRLHAHQVLRVQAGFGPARADVAQMKGLPRKQ